MEKEEKYTASNFETNWIHLPSHLKHYKSVNNIPHRNVLSNSNVVLFINKRSL